MTECMIVNDTMSMHFVGFSWDYRIFISYMVYNLKTVYFKNVLNFNLFLFSDHPPKNKLRHPS